MQQVFENGGALLEFLYTDEPELYVFRGQTQAYEGPMLPSGCRDHFIPFESSNSTSEWAGVTEAHSVIKKSFISRSLNFSSRVKTERIIDRNTTWDLSEVAYQAGFREFFNQPHISRMNEVRDLLRNGSIPAMPALLGGNLAQLLCQQYGFTSTALDVSTDPTVAMFFATHQAPFYNPIIDFSRLGVIYRWPKDRAMVAQDLLLPLENPAFESIILSFRNFVEESTDLITMDDTLIRHISAKKEWHKRQMWLLSTGQYRSHRALRFPVGAFERSRMGRQHAALLWPKFEIVKPLKYKNDGDRAALMR